jgi:hypothetical protein
VGDDFEFAGAHLQAESQARRAQKQKALKQFVIMRSRFKAFVFEEFFRAFAVGGILEKRHGRPWLTSFIISVHRYH